LVRAYFTNLSSFGFFYIEKYLAEPIIPLHKFSGEFSKLRGLNGIEQEFFSKNKK